MSKPPLGAIARHMIVVLLYGAARIDATPSQLEELRKGVDLLKDPAIPLKQVAQHVFDVMGPDWSPRADFLTQIQALSGKS